MTDLKNHVIIHQDGNQIYHEGSMLNIPSDGDISGDQVQHLVVDGQVNSKLDSSNKISYWIIKKMETIILVDWK